MEDTTTPAGKKAKKSEPLSGEKAKPKTGRSQQPPKKRKKGADGTAIKSDNDADADSGMWSSDTE